MRLHAGGDLLLWHCHCWPLAATAPSGSTAWPCPRVTLTHPLEPALGYQGRLPEQRAGAGLTTCPLCPAGNYKMAIGLPPREMGCGRLPQSPVLQTVGEGRLLTHT